MAVANFTQAKATAIDHALDGPIEMVIGTWAPPNSNDSFVLSRLHMAEDVAADFRAVGHRHVNRLLNADVIGFDLGFTPDDDRVMRLPAADFDEPQLIQEILNPGGLPFFNLDGHALVAFHCFIARRQNVRAGFLHRASSVAVARRNRITGILADNTVTRLDANVLTFAPAVDILLEPDGMWISNLAAFRSLFRTMPTLTAGVEADLAVVTANIPVANLDDFRQACANDVRMMAKLANVARKPYIANLTTARIRQVINRYNLPPEILDAHGRFVHDNSPARRWLILRILDDSYLESLMTHSHYEVNSKLQVN
jgi:hypothetical protein